jgi:hypothetical protein
VDLLREVERLARRPGVRSADRANIRRLVARAREGKQLTPNEREQLWAYLEHYGVAPTPR